MDYESFDRQWSWVGDPGQAQPDGRLREYRYCREIAAEVVKALKVRGVDAELLTPEESDVSLAERCRRVNAHCAELGSANVCLVSIHNNAAGSGAQWMSARGWEAWTSRGQTRGDGLADCLYAAAAEVLQECIPPEKSGRISATAILTKRVISRY